jgi:hypothetical protein
MARKQYGRGYFYVKYNIYYIESWFFRYPLLSSDIVQTLAYY